MSNTETGISENHASALLIEKVGQNNIDHILDTLSTVPWGVSFLKLAWTAGPLTFIALQGGYLLGYGSPASYNLFIYFAGYTLITGLASLITSIVSTSKSTRKIKKARKNINYTVDKIFDYIEACKDIQFSTLNAQEQKYAMAYRILQNSHADPDAVALAIHEVSGDWSLAKGAKKIDLLRRANILPLIDELAQENQDARLALVDKLSVSHPRLAELISERLQGIAPCLKTGLIRIEGFLQRIFYAAETGHLSQMSIRDAEEFLLLIFELMNDRSIEVLRFHFSGKKKVAELTYQLERMRAVYQLTRSNLNYRVQELFAHLVDNGIIEYQDEENIQEIITSSYQAITSLAEAVMKARESTKAHQNQLSIFLKSISLYASVLNAQKQLVEKEKTYTKLFTLWRKTSAKQQTNTILNYGKGKRGLRIIDYTLHFDDQEKVDFVNAITSTLKEFDEQIKKNPSKRDILIKKMIIALAAKTNEFISISDPINRVEIESSNATNFSSIEHNYSVKAKIGLATALTNEVVTEYDKAIEQLARIFVQHYGESLEDNMIQFLSEYYDADPKKLREIQQSGALVNLASLEGQSLMIKPLHHSWKQAKETVLRQLNKTK